jgi:hypothetical protein
MNADEIDCARAAFSEFERDMTASGARSALQEGLDHALDIIECQLTDPKLKRTAQNLICSYQRKLCERIEAEIDDVGSFGDDRYSHWMTLVEEFEDSGRDEDKALSQLKVDLLRKRLNILSNDERCEVVRLIQGDTDGE